MNPERDNPEGDGDAPDGEAFAWQGDDDPTLVATPTALPDGYTAVGRGSESVTNDADAEAVTTDSGEPASTGNAALIAVGVFAGIYLLLAIGWILGAARLQLVAQLFLEPVAFQVTMWLAVLAPPIWFVTTLVLTRGGRGWIRFTALAAGAILLVPWPFVLAGATL